MAVPARGLTVRQVMLGAAERNRFDVVCGVCATGASRLPDHASSVTLANGFRPCPVCCGGCAGVAFAPPVLMLVAVSGGDNGGAALDAAVLRGAWHQRSVVVLAQWSRVPVCHARLGLLRGCSSYRLVMAGVVSAWLISDGLV